MDLSRESEFPADLSPLAWVQEELRRTLEAVHKSLRRVLRDVDARVSILGGEGQASPALQTAAQQMHQAAGVLAVVNLPAAAQLLRAAEATVARLAESPTSVTAADVEAVERADFAVLSFIAKALAGAQPPSLALFPAYQALQALNGAARIHPADLWPHEWRWRELPLDASVHALTPEQMRPAFEAGLLKQMRAPAPAQAQAQALSDLCAGLARTQLNHQARTVWQLAAALFEAQAQGLLQADTLVKRLGSRLLAQLRAGSDAAVSERLAKDLLFFCAQAAAPAGQAAPRLQSVRQVYELASAEAGSYEDDSLGRIDPGWVQQAKRRVAQAKESWASAAEGETHRLAGMDEQFAAVAGSLQQLFPSGEVLGDTLRRAVVATLRSGQAPQAPLAMEIATSLLYLEAALEDEAFDQPEQAERVKGLARRIEAVAHGEPSAALEAWMEELYRRVSDRQTLGSVVHELRASLSEVERQCDDYFRDPAKRALLIPVPGQLQAMRGVFSVLGLAQAAQTCLRMRDQVDELANTEVDPSLPGPRAQFDRLAHNLGGLGFLIDMLSVQPQLAKRMFRFDEESGLLQSLVGRESEQQAASAAPASTEAAPALLEQLQATAAAVAQGERPAEELARDLERLSHEARAADEPALAQAAQQAQVLLDGGDSGEGSAAQSLQDYLQAAAPAPAPVPAPSAPIPSAAADIDEEMLGIFLEEADEVLATAREALTALAQDGGDREQLTTVRRAFHTLKGSSRMVGLQDFGEGAWAMEQLYNQRLAEQPQADSELLSLSHQALDYLAAWRDAIAAGQLQGEHNSQPLRASADAMRLQGLLQPLEAQAEAPVAEPLMTLGAESVTGPAELIEHEAEAAPLPAAIPELTQALPELTQALPELADVLELSALADTAQPLLPAQPTPAEPALELSAELPVELPDLAEVTEVLDLAELPSEPLLDLSELPTPSPVEGASATSPFDFEEPTEVLEMPSDWPQAALDEPALSLGEFATEPMPLEVVLDAPADAPEPLLMEPLDLSSPAPELAELALPAAELPEIELRLDLGEEALQREAAVPESEPEPTLAEPQPPAAAGDLEPAPALDQPAAAVPGLSLVGGTDIDGHDDGQGQEEMAEAVDDEGVKVIGPLRISIALFNIFLNEADERSRRLQVELAEWALLPQQPLPGEAEALAHGLAGSAATVGFEALSGLARALELALGRAQGHQVPEPSLFEQGADEIRRLLHQFAAGFLKEADAVLLAQLQAFQPGPALPEEGADSEPAPLPVAAVEDFDFSLPDQIEPELMPIFEEEAEDLLRQLHAALREWAAQPQDGGRAAACMRVLHTFKGGARLAGAMRLGEQAHALESQIERLLAQGRPEAAQLQALQDEGDALEQQFLQLQRSWREPVHAPTAPADVVALPEPAAEPEPLPALLVEPQTVQATDAASPAPADVEIDWAHFSAEAGTGQPLESAPVAPAAQVRVRGVLLERMAALSGEVSIRRARLESELGQMKVSLADLDDNLERLRTQLRELELQAEARIAARQEAAQASGKDFDPLEFDRYTRFQELTRMLAESVNDVATVQRGLQRNVATGEDELAAQSRLTRELQDDLLRTRMVEFDASLAERLHRVVRQAARESGKQVQLEIQGGGVELDRSVLERLTGAFEHLLRNSVVHGIESPEQRQAAAKPAMGRIALSLHQEGNEVQLRFADDGAGLNLTRIRARAEALGLVAAGQALGDAQLMELIYEPGFTTADSLTEMAGRGVGMDVVRSEVNTLGGYVLTHSSPGQGASFELRVPLTTALTQVVVLRHGERKVAVPASLMLSVQRLTPEQVEQAYAAGHITLAGEQLPFHWLGGLMHEGARGQVQGKTVPVVLVHSAQQRLALHVDEVMGNQEVVIKNLGPQLMQVPGLAGISLLASGEVALIYNPVALANRYGHAAHQRLQEAAAPRSEQQPAVQAPLAPLVLVVDDSLTVRRVTQRLLEREGYRVLLAKDGLDAMERLAGEELPRVVLSDIEMPRMDGFDLVRNLRADARLAALPVIMITSRIAQKHRDYAHELGVDDYLGKPYDEEHLLSLIARYTSSQTEGRKAGA
jgi:chemosensory pili system protein ChpA (sensor histidine kinase/response regulator)